MSKRSKKFAATEPTQVGDTATYQNVDIVTEETAPGMTDTPQAEVEETPKPVAAPKVDATLVLGSKAPKHRVGHTGAAWTAILPLLPCAASKLAALPELQVPQCGGPKGNGMLYVGYAIRRGWLAKQAS